MNKRHDLPDNQRVVVTGVGMATPLGTGREEFSRRLFQGESAIDAVRAFDTGAAASRLGAEVRGFHPREFISVKNLRRMDRMSLLVTASARLALSDAGIAVTAENRDRVGILFGSAFGATDVTVQFEDTLFAQGPGAVNPILVPNTVMNAPAGHASIELGFRGVNVTVTHFAVSALTGMLESTPVKLAWQMKLAYFQNAQFKPTEPLYVTSLLLVGLDQAPAGMSQ